MEILIKTVKVLEIFWRHYQQRKGTLYFNDKEIILY